MIKLTDLLKEQYEEEQFGPVRDKFDSTYNYQVRNGVWHTQKKGNDNWISLAGNTVAIRKLNSQYPYDLKGAVKTTKSDREKVKSKSPVISPFDNIPDEKDFQDWVNNKFNRDVTGGYGWGSKSQAAWDEYGAQYEKEMGVERLKTLTPVAKDQLAYAKKTGVLTNKSFIIVSKKYNLMYLFDKQGNLVYTSAIVDGSNYGANIDPKLELGGKTHEEWREYSREFFEGTGAFSSDKIKAIAAQGTGPYSQKEYNKWKAGHQLAKKEGRRTGVYWYEALNDDGKMERFWQPISYKATLHHPKNIQYTPAGWMSLDLSSKSHKQGYEDVEGFTKAGDNNVFSLMSLDQKLRYSQAIHGTIRGRMNIFKELDKQLNNSAKSGVTGPIPEKYINWMNKAVADYQDSYKLDPKAPKFPGASAGCINIRSTMVSKIRQYQPAIVMILSNSEDGIVKIPKADMDRMLAKMHKDGQCESKESFMDRLFRIGTNLYKQSKAAAEKNPKSAIGNIGQRASSNIFSPINKF